MATNLSKQVVKEEKWLLLENQLLEEFIANVNEILEIKDKISKLQKTTDQPKKIKKLVTNLTDLIHGDQNKFKKFRRQLGRNERRRIRYEQRVLGSMAQMETDDVSKSQLSKLIEQIHVYSARILTELSWRVGRIESITSSKKVNLDLLKNHLNFTSQSVLALIVLLERLEKLLSSFKNRMHKNNMAQSILPSIAGMSGYVRDGAIKTAALRSIPEIASILGNMRGSEEFKNILKKHETELLKILTQQDIELLSKTSLLRYSYLPSTSIFIFWRNLVILHNPDKLRLYNDPGWLFHAIPGENLTKIDKLLESPLETVFRQKHYHSFKFWDNAKFPKRLIDGVSFSFQDYTKYLTPNYMSQGGFFLFQSKEVLGSGLILNFNETMDGFPEVALRGINYHKHNPIIVRECLISLREGIPELLRILPAAQALLDNFESEFLEKLKQSLHLLKIDPGSSQPTLMSNEFDNKIYFTDFVNAEKLRRKLNAIEYEIMDFTQREKKRKEILKKQHAAAEKISVLSGDGYLAKFISKNLSQQLKSRVEFLIDALENNNLFKLALIIQGHYYSDQKILPPLARFALGTAPTTLAGSIFKTDSFTYVNEEQLADQINYPRFIMLTFMKKNPRLFRSRPGYSIQDYLNEIYKLSYRKFKKLLQETIKELSKSLEVIVQARYKTASAPCTVNTCKGTLFMPSPASRSIVKKVLNFNVAIFVCSIFTPHAYRDELPINSLDQFFQEIFPLKSLPGGWRKFQNSFLYLAGKGRLVQQKKDGSKAMLG